MDYTLESFNELSGQLLVRFGSLPSVVIDVPIEGGEYITGDALLAYIRGFVPTWAVARQEAVSAKPSGVEALKAMCEDSRMLEEALPYGAQRLREYPPMSDYLDAIVKGDVQAQQEYIAACLAVKAKYPKPPVELVSAEVLAARREL